MDEADDLLDEPCVDEERRVLELITSFILNQPLDYLTEEDVKLIELAMEKVKTGLEEAKKKVLTEEDILGLSKIRVNSPAVSVVMTAVSTSEESRISDVSNMDSDLDLDYDEYIAEELPIESRSGSSTPKNDSDVSVVYLSSDTETEDVEDHRERKKKYPSNNSSNSDFSETLTRKEQYLKMKKIKSPVDVTKIDLVYPLGVTFDSRSRIWFITDKMKNTVVKINVGSDRRERGYSVIKSRYITSPTAITVLKEGSAVAILCAEAPGKPVIRILDIRTGNVSDFCGWRNDSLDFKFQARGLARSLGGNLLTTDRPLNGSPRLRVFTEDHRQKAFDLHSAELPSFIAASRSTVVITDLGKEQIVLLCKLDDSNFKKTEFQVLRTISTCGINLKASEMINKQYFMYVSGAQIDMHGNILIADAKNHHFKLFKPSMGFIHRVATDFPVPYVSSFHVNEDGEVLILSTRNDNVNFAKLTATDRLERHIACSTGRRPAEKSYFSRNIHRTNSREGLKSIRTVERSRSGSSCED